MQSRKSLLSVRQWYARTDVNDKRFVTVEIAVPDFWCALYRLDVSNLTFRFVIKR